ncbi:MAG: diacylglycerol kinase family lipid kinase [Propionicimonas sp.]
MSEQTTPWAIVVNPTKFDDLTAVRARVSASCATHGWPVPAWYETTVEDPGSGQAREAVEAGARLVCPLGGDGTVRAVATALLDGETSIGLLPGGTGNLLARNLGLPIDDLEAALEVAVTGRDTPVDAGLVSFDEREPEVFLVMAGMGIDAEAVAGASVELKRQLGWVAYAVSGLKSLVRPGFSVRVSAGGRRTSSQRAATVMIGNCGELTAGLQLMPDARVDDGLLDVVVLTPRSIFSWVRMAAYLVTRLRLGYSPVTHLQGPKVDIVAAHPIDAQVDGDPVGRVTTVTCAVRQGALRVRVRA